MSKTPAPDGVDEREFLHNLATPLGAAYFLAEALLEEFKSKEGTDSDHVLKITQVIGALERMKKLLSERRDSLIQG